MCLEWNTVTFRMEHCNTEVLPSTTGQPGLCSNTHLEMILLSAIAQQIVQMIKSSTGPFLECPTCRGNETFESEVPCSQDSFWGQTHLESQTSVVPSCLPKLKAPCVTRCVGTFCLIRLRQQKKYIQGTTVWHGLPTMNLSISGSGSQPPAGLSTQRKPFTLSCYSERTEKPQWGLLLHFLISLFAPKGTNIMF